MLLTVKGKDKRIKISMSIEIGNILNINEDGTIFLLYKHELKFMEGRSIEDCDIRYFSGMMIYEMKNFYSINFNRG